MDMEVIVFDGVESFEQTGNTLSTEEPMWKFLKQFERRRRLKIAQFYTCI